MASSEESSPECATMVECTSLLVESILSDVDNIGTELFSRNLLSFSDRETLQLTGPGSEPSKKANRIIDTIISKIKVNPRRFDDFVEVLKSRGDFMTDCVHEITECYTKKVNVQHRDDFKPGFKCHCGGCSFKDFFMGGCPEVKKTELQKGPQFPFLNTPKLSKSDRELLERKLLSEHKKIKESFAFFYVLVSRSSSEYPIEEIKVYLLMMKAFSPEERAELKNAKTKSDILFALCNHISFFNYDLLEQIITTFAPSDKPLLTDYLTKFTAFCERSVFEVPPSDYHGESSESEKYFSLKYSHDGPITLNQVKSVCLNIADILKIDSWSLRLASIEDGCVLLKFSVPKEVAKTVLPLSPDQDVLLNAAALR